MIDPEKDIFINARGDTMPHAVEQFLLRAEYPPGFSMIEAERILRKLIAREINSGRRLENRDRGWGQGDEEFLVRVHDEGRAPVFVVVQTGVPDGKYKYLVHTVLSKDMYDSWNREGKLGSIGDAVDPKIIEEAHAKVENRPPPAEDEMRIVLWDFEGTVQFKEVRKYAVPGEILSLLGQGTPWGDIRVFREEKFDLRVVLK